MDSFLNHSPYRNLDDGTHIVHPHRYAQLDAESTDLSRSSKALIPAHKNFRVIAIAAPVPPYPGYPLDPPFRSRFQARFLDPVGSLLALLCPMTPSNSPLYEKLRDIILTTQIASESRNALEVISKSALPPFPQTALAKLNALVTKFPPPSHLSPSQLARLILAIHPGLIYAPLQAWALLSRHTDESGLGELGNPSMSNVGDFIGLFGYRIVEIVRIDECTARVSFEAPHGNRVVAEVPVGSNPLHPFPLKGNPEFHPTERFMGLLTCFLQAHAMGWDISLIPPALPSTASSSTSTLVRVFGQLLGYEMDVVHMYKELGGRELVMRRKIDDGGATTWEPR